MTARSLLCAVIYVCNASILPLPDEYGWIIWSIFIANKPRRFTTLLSFFAMFMCMIIYYLVWITLLEWSPPIILLFFIPTTSREMDSVVFNFPFKRSNPTLANLLLVYYFSTYAAIIIIWFVKRFELANCIAEKNSHVFYPGRAGCLGEYSKCRRCIFLCCRRTAL